MNKMRRYVGVGMLLLIVASIGGYVYYQAQHIARGSILRIEAPQNGVTVTVPLLDLTGIATNVAKIRLNGREIFVDEAGRFTEQVLLAQGYNILTVEMRDKFNRTFKSVREVIYQPL